MPLACALISTYKISIGEQRKAPCELCSIKITHLPDLPTAPIHHYQICGRNMQLPGRFSGVKRRGRLERFNIVVAILLAGWVPSILMLVVSYTILTNTLESKILRDRQTFVQLTARLVADDLSSTSATVDFYQAQPSVAKIFSDPNRAAAAEQWLNSAYFSHPRIDGMFLTDDQGRLIAGMPSTPAMIGQDYASGL